MNTVTQQVITVDYKITRQVKTVSFLQYDTNEIKFIVEDGGSVADLSNITQILVNFKRPDKQVISQILTANGNEIVYRLTNTEMAKQGVCEMVLQLYDNNDRISIAKFNVHILDNIEFGEEPTFEEVPLVTQLISELSNVKSTLNNKRDISTKIKSSDLDTSSDATKIQLVHLSNEVQQAMTGNTSISPVIADNSLTTGKYANSSVTSVKRTPLGEYAFIHTPDGSPNFNFTNKTLTFPYNGNTYEVIHGKNTYVLPPQNVVVDLTLSGTYSRGLVTFNTLTSQFKVYDSGNKANITENEIMIAVFYLGTKTAYMNCTFTIDGVTPIANNSVTPSKISDLRPMLKQVKVLRGGQNLISINSVNKTFTFPSNQFDTVFYVGDTVYSKVVPESGLTISLAPITGSSAWCLLFNTSDYSFLLVQWNNLASYKNTHAIFATCRLDSGKYIFNMDCPFLLDGLLYGVSPTNALKGTENRLDAFVKGIAHRGYSATAPENTLPAYTLAKQNGFSYVEADIEWTSDNVPVLLHDTTINRTSNGTGNIKDLTLEYVKTLDFGAWKGVQYTGTKIPTFDEFILFCKKNSLHPYLELKDTINLAQANILVDIVKKYNMTKKVSWISFNGNALTLIAQVLPTARIGLVMSTANENQISQMAAMKTDINEVFLDMPASSATAEFAQKVFQQGMDLEVWTVNNASQVHSLVAMGISGITTDSLNIADVLSQ